jgi:hypothetical protein
MLALEDANGSEERETTEVVKNSWSNIDFYQLPES